MGKASGKRSNSSTISIYKLRSAPLRTGDTGHGNRIRLQVFAHRALRLYFAVFGTPDLHTHLRLSPFLRQAAAAVERYRISRIFEPGCRRGINAFEINKKGLRTPYFGNDFNPDDIASAQKITSDLKLDHVIFAHADATTAIPKNDAYNAVLLLDIIEHIPDDAAFVRALSKTAPKTASISCRCLLKPIPKSLAAPITKRLGMSARAIP